VIASIFVSKYITLPPRSRVRRGLPRSCSPNNMTCFHHQEFRNLMFNEEIDDCILCDNEKLERANEDLLKKVFAAQQDLYDTAKKNAIMEEKCPDLHTDYPYLKDAFHELLFNGLHGKCERFPHITSQREECSEDYVLGNEVIESHVGRSVVGAVKRRNGERVVVKIRQKRIIRRFREMELIDAEIGTLRKLQHPNIVQLLDVWETPSCLNMAFERFGNDLYYVMEPYPNKMPEYLIGQVTTPLISILKYIHDQNIAHCDLKPENIMVCMNADESRCSVKLTDFELAIEVGDDDYALPQGPRGSEGFMAPEMFAKRAFNPMKSDIWSLGCVLHELLVGHAEFNDRWMVHYSNLIARDMSNVDDFLEDLRLSVDITSEDIGNSQFCDLLKSTLEISPYLRSSAAEILIRDRAAIEATNIARLPPTRMRNPLRRRIDEMTDASDDACDDELDRLFDSPNCVLSIHRRTVEIPTFPPSPGKVERRRIE